MTEAVASTSLIVSSDIGLFGSLKKAERRSAGHQLVPQRESLGPEFTIEGVEARKVASRSIETSNKPELHGVSGDAEHEWDASGCGLNRESRENADSDDNGRRNVDQFSGHCRQSISLVSAPVPVFDHEIPALNVAAFVEPTPKASQTKFIGFRRPKA